MRVPLRHNSSKKKRFKYLILALVIIGIGMMMPKLISAVSAIVMSPIHATHAWWQESSSLAPTFFRERKVLHEKITSLEHELVVSKRSDLTQQRLREENERLRNLMGTGGDARVAAGIIARPNQLPYDLLQIDRGSAHGIDIGAPVFIGSDIVIGLIVHTAEKYSFVQLITTPGFQATVFVSGPDITVPLEGIGGGVARVKIPQGIPLAVGNLVYLPSIDPGVFGRISHIDNHPTQPEQYGYVVPDIAISSIKFVSVGTLSQRVRSVEEVEENIMELLRNELNFERVKVGIIATSSSDVTDTQTPEDIIE